MAHCRDKAHVFRESKGCRSFSYGRGVENPDKAIFLLRWDSVEAHEAARGGLGGRRLQAVIIGLVVLASTAASTLALAMLADSSSPFDHSFAAQHGANVHDAIRSLAENDGFTKARVQDLGYKAQESLPEVLGSSSRYGYRYGEKDLWETEDHVQCYLDHLAWDTGLLNARERQLLTPMLEFLALSQA